MLQSLREETDGKLQMLLSPRKNGLTSLFKEVRVFKAPQFQEKRSRSEKAILGALGEFRGILGAALGIGNSILGIRNSILGMASHDLSNTKPTILGATLGAIPGIAANPPERFSFAPAFSERFFKNWGGPRAPEFRLHGNATFSGAGCRLRRCPWSRWSFQILRLPRLCILQVAKWYASHSLTGLKKRIIFHLPP